jgi:hypothetical protein
LFPDEFESTASQRRKEGIVTTFRELAGNSEDLDEALPRIRQALAEKHGDPNIQFYQSDIKKLWHKEPKADATTEKEKREEPSSAAVSCWVEKPSYEVARTANRENMRLVVLFGVRS